MNCENIKVQLSAYIDGEAPEKDAVTIGKHIAICADCAQAEQQLRMTSQLLKNWDHVSAPDGFCEALLARAENMSRQPRRSIFDAVRPLAGPGALVRATVYGTMVLLLCVAVIFFTKLPLRRAPTAEPLSIQTESALQNADDDIQISDNSLRYTTMAEMRVAKIWEYKEQGLY